MTTTDSLQLTEHEILALLAFNDGESTALTREIFRLTPQADNEQLTKAGMTTLLVRGLAELSDSDLVLKGPTEFIAAVMATAGDWLEIALVTPERNHVMFAVASAGGAFVANANGNGTHGFTPLKNDRPVLKFGLDAAAHYLGDSGLEPDGSGSPGRRPVAAQIKHHGLGVQSKTANLMVDESGTWQLATGDGDQLAKREVDGSVALELFEEALELDHDTTGSE
ncbi:hypothetical protein ASH00_01810 [Arthrobacter sp. Soil782]|uniref:hypothetical protein n=1 Tax=Arthrobacter sp. Soil782 TaxID=1736410 RepID=UPI0006F48E5C|nr:hypothetical protein [Arthrobacter sp. Soil782]KRF08482.1 hypothetical protein ASH00_01810 [Arthrobacter sp. Soil782]